MDTRLAERLLGLGVSLILEERNRERGELELVPEGVSGGVAEEGEEDMPVPCPPGSAVLLVDLDVDVLSLTGDISELDSDWLYRI